MEFVFVYLIGVVIGILGSITHTYFFPPKGEITHGVEMTMGILAWPISLMFGFIMGSLFIIAYLFLWLCLKIDAMLLWVADKGRKQGH